jgi:hypothetical protein
MGWLVIELNDGSAVHIVPDYEEHELTMFCPCVPAVEHQPGWDKPMYAHNDLFDIAGVPEPVVVI